MNDDPPTFEESDEFTSSGEFTSSEESVSESIGGLCCIIL
jgi:hypothetical protein